MSRAKGTNLRRRQRDGHLPIHHRTSVGEYGHGQTVHVHAAHFDGVPNRLRQFGIC